MQEWKTIRGRWSRRPQSSSDFLDFRGFRELFRPDAHRPADIGRGGLRLGSEEHAAARAELRLVLDHANRDAVDIGNEGAADAHRIAAAGLLLLGSISLACRRPHRHRQRGRQHQTDMQVPGTDSHRKSPRSRTAGIVGEGQRISKEDGSENGKANRNVSQPCRGKHGARFDRRRRAMEARWVVQLGGLEPPTSCSTDRRSNQLSYNCILRRPRKRGGRTGRKLGATPVFGKADGAIYRAIRGPSKTTKKQEARAVGPGLLAEE